MSEQKTILNPDGSITTKIEAVTLWKLKSQDVAKHCDGEDDLVDTLRLDWKQPFDDQGWRWHLLNKAPVAGIYDVFFETGQKNLLYCDLESEQGRADGWNPACASIVVQTIMNYFRATGIKLLDGEWTRVTDGAWSVEYLSGEKQTNHMRIGCSTDNHILVDFDLNDDQADAKTGVTMIQYKK